MTLVEHCEPLFLYVCRINRAARSGLRPEAATVRAEVKAILADLKAKAATDRNLVTQFDRIELVLMYFVDSVIPECLGPAARGWRSLQEERTGESVGDQKFFELLEETLREGGEAATERLAVFYTCIGLGFTGWYTGQPEYLRKKMLEISARIRGMVDADHAARICPEAYEHVNTSNLVVTPGRGLVGIGIAVAVLFVTVCVANVVLYVQSEGALRRATDQIRAAGRSAPPAPSDTPAAEERRR